MSPLVVEWDPESGTRLADVTDAGFASDFVLSERAVDTLQPFSSWHAGPVEIVNIGAAFSRQRLSDLLADRTVSADLDASSIELERRCGTCGMSFWHIRGVGRREWKPDQIGHPTSVEVPRTDVGIVVRSDALGTADIFKVEQAPAWTLITDVVRDAMTEARLSGVRCFEVGSIID